MWELFYLKEAQYQNMQESLAKRGFQAPSSPPLKKEPREDFEKDDSGCEGHNQGKAEEEYEPTVRKRIRNENGDFEELDEAYTPEDFARVEDEALDWGFPLVPDPTHPLGVESTLCRYPPCNLETPEDAESDENVGWLFKVCFPAILDFKLLTLSTETP